MNHIQYCTHAGVSAIEIDEKLPSVAAESVLHAPYISSVILNKNITGHGDPNIIIFCLNCLLWHRHLLWVFCSVPGGSGQVTFTPTAPFPRKTISLVSPYANLKLINPNVYYMVGRLGTNFGRTVGKRSKEDGKRLQKDILVLCGTSLNYVHIFIFKTLISDKVCIGK